MSSTRSINRTGAFSLQEKRHLRNLVNSIYGVEKLSVPAGVGITSGTGAVYKSAVSEGGGEVPVITTRIFVDLTGLGSSTTDLDIIGVGASPAHLGQIKFAQNGTIFGGKISCIEAPATGADDIDLYAAAEGTGVFDGIVTDLTETALVTSGAAWVAGRSVSFTASPAADAYLYLTAGEAGTPETYTAGKFLIELYGSKL